MRTISIITVMLLFVFINNKSIAESNSTINQNSKQGFIENKGQIADADGNLHPEVLYKTQKNNATLFLKKNSVVFLFNKFETVPTEESRKERALGNLAHARILETKPYIYRMDLNFVNANPDVEVIPLEQTKELTNFYLPQCPDGITKVKKYQKIIYKNLYPNIDLVYYFKEKGLKYDFIVRPGGHVSDIKLQYKGANNVVLTRGALKVFYATDRQLTEDEPVAFYQNGEEEKVKFNYNAENKIFGFSAKKNTFSKTLIIDPAISWATYFYNSSSSETTINNYSEPKFDANGNFFYAAQTYDNAFPTVNPGGSVWFDGSSSTMIKVVIMKFDANRSLVWSTYYGGDQYDCLAGCTDYGKALALDNSGNVYVAGYTTSNTTVFPTYNPGGGAFYQDQSKCYGETSFFLKFDNDGVRKWATMFQHENSNTNYSGIRINSICTDGSNLYYSGQTYRSNSNDIPLRNPGGGAYYQSTFVGGMDAFVGKFNTSQSLIWSTYINSGNTSNTAYAAGLDVTCDENGNFYMVGRETGNTGPVVHHLIVNPGGGAFMQSTPNGSQNIQITKFNTSLSAVWSTYYGGEDMDIPSTIEPDGFGHIFIVGRRTESATFPTYDPGGGAYCQTTKPTAANNPDGFGIKFNESTCARMWASFLGGSGSSAQSHFPGLAFDSDGNVYMSGYTNSSNMTTMNQTGSYNQSSIGGDNDMFYYEFNSSMQMQWGTYFGGSGYDRAYNQRMANYEAPCGVKILSMIGTANTNLSTVDPGGGAWYQTNGGATNNDFLIEFSNASTPLPVSVTISTSNTTICSGDNVTFTATPVNGGTSPSYQWYLNGSPVGTNSSTYSNSSLSNSDNVYCVLTSSESCVSGSPATSNTITITVNTNSTAPTSVSVSSNPICSGNSTTLSVNGGSLGSGASWEWYTGSCGGTSVGTGSSITVSPTSTTTYYVRAEGSCNTTTCVSKTITVNTSSVAATSATATNSTICSGSSTTISVSGGSLGSGATWEWYTGSCGGTSVGTGSSITVSPTSTTTYYVRAEGTCNTTSCVSVSITVNTNSSDPLSISATNSTICEGEQTTLSVQSIGILGTGADWYWYTGSCGGTSVGTGSSITVSPTSTTTYYVRAEGTCNTTSCVSKTITVNTSSVAATSATATNSTICSGSSTIISVSGGSLGSGATWEWYTGSCGGTSVGTGSSITVSPTSTTTYYVRAEGTCNTTTCVSKTITVNTNSTSPTSVNATVNPVCEGSASTLSIVGGVLGTGATWEWYEGGCGSGSAVGTGTSITINPTNSTTYYVRAEGTCNTTSCASIAVTVTPGANAGISQSVSVCEGAGNLNLLSELGGSPSGGGTWTNSLNDTVSNIFNPSTMASDVFTYTVLGNPPCGDASATVTVTVNPLPNVSFTGLDSMYCGTGTVLLTGNQAPNGTFSGTDIIDNGDGTATYNYLTTGTHNIIYSYTNSNVCTSVDTQVVTVYNMPSVVFVGLDTSYCEGSNIINIIGNQAPDGSFFGIGITDNGNGSATYTPSTVGLQTIVYQYTDINNCTAVDSQMVEVFENPSIDTLIVTDVSCSGADGAIQSQVSGGDGAYTYLWSNDSTTSNISELSVGSYTLTLTDGNGCFSQLSTMVQNSTSGLSTNISNYSDVDCNGNNTGSATVSVNGSGPFNYLWSNGDTTDVINNLAAGTYFVTVQDSLGCQGIDTVVISEPLALTYNDSIINITCYGYNNGKIYLNVIGGTPNYTYSWQGGGGFTSSNEYLSNLSSGEYTVTVVDANGCSFNVDKLSVTEPDTSLYISVNSNPPLCYGNNDGIAISEANGGTPPYIYNWSNGDMGSSTTNLGEGEYYLTVTDANFCNLVDTVKLLSPEKIEVTENITDASCIGNNNGKIILNISGGVKPYTLVWNTDQVNADTIAENLTYGEYTVTITDFNKCAVTYSYNINEGSEICLEIPTAITPNGDGVNDDWELKGIWIYDDIHIEIYNRWGDIIFEFDGSGSDYDSKRWDGTYNGKELPISSYVFIVNLKDGNDPIQGVVTIVK